MTSNTRALSETCSICGKTFDVQFRYQMEDGEEGFSFYCSQQCLDQSHRQGPDGMVSCSACLKRFRVQSVAHVMYVHNRRKYACSAACRQQILDEGRGAKLGEIASMKPAKSTETPRPATVHDALATPSPIASAPRGATGGTGNGSGGGVDGITRQVFGRGNPAEPPGQRQEQRAEPSGHTVSLSPSVAAPTNGQTNEQSASGTAVFGPTTFAIFNHKGGTGKTTTSVSIAAGLASAGHRVLLVDTDAQGNVGVSLNCKSARSLYHVLVMGMPLTSVVQKVRENLDLVPSNETLAAAELYLAGRQNRDRVLRERLSVPGHGYDFVILDCSPSLSLLNQNALVFADNVLVPVACDYLSLVGVRQVIKTVRNVNNLLHHPVRLWGVLPTFYDSRANICREAVATLTKHFGDRCLSPIRSAIKVKEAPAHGQTIFEFAGQSRAAQDYMAVIDQIVAYRQHQVQPSRASAVSA